MTMGARDDPPSSNEERPSSSCAATTSSSPANANDVVVGSITEPTADDKRQKMAAALAMVSEINDQIDRITLMVDRRLAEAYREEEETAKRKKKTTKKKDVGRERSEEEEGEGHGSDEILLKWPSHSSSPSSSLSSSSSSSSGGSSGDDRRDPRPVAPRREGRERDGAVGRRLVPRSSRGTTTKHLPTRRFTLSSTSPSSYSSYYSRDKKTKGENDAATTSKDGDAAAVRRRWAAETKARVQIDNLVALLRSKGATEREIRSAMFVPNH